MRSRSRVISTMLYRHYGSRRNPIAALGLNYTRGLLLANAFRKDTRARSPQEYQTTFQKAQLRPELSVRQETEIHTVDDCAVSLKQ